MTKQGTKMVIKIKSVIELLMVINIVESMDTGQYSGFKKQFHV
jgi:hypothetical protein